MTEWFMPCNVNHYDTFGAFSELKRINWRQTTNVEAGDIAYIYLTSPYSSIRFKCRVDKVNLSEEEAVIDDAKFDLSNNQTENWSGSRYMELELLEDYTSPFLTLDWLYSNGLPHVRSTQRVSRQLSAYLTRITSQLANEAEDADLIREVNQSIPHDAEDHFTYRGRKKRKSEPKIRGGQSVYIRDKQTALNALAHAGYLCEIDAAHPTFIRRSSGKRYTEPHHLVPLAASEQFEVSLDVEENIVSLCSSCHNQIHYGEGADGLLTQLYEARVRHLKKVGIHISLDELLGMYF